MVLPLLSDLIFLLFGCFYSVFLIFNYNMPWKLLVLVLSVWGSVWLLYLEGHLSLKIWENIFYYFIENILYVFGMLFFFPFYAHSLKVRVFHGVLEFSYVLFMLILVFDISRGNQFLCLVFQP